MLSASSPVIYPPSSSPPVAKRPNPHPNPKPRARTSKSGFLIDDDSDNENEDASVEPAPKRRMLSSPRELSGTEITEPSSPPLIPSIQEPKGIQLHPRQPESQPTQPTNGTSQSQSRSLDSIFASTNTPSLFERLSMRQPHSAFKITTCSGKDVQVKKRMKADIVSYQTIVAARSRTKEGRAKRSYYGIDIHQLVEGASKELAKKAPGPDLATFDAPIPSVEDVQPTCKPKKSMLWTEKYRAKNFMDLVGDDHTNRQVLRWLKRWDPLVFSRAAKSKPVIRRPGIKQQVEEEKPHRKILMLTGAPGLGSWRSMQATTAARMSSRTGYVLRLGPKASKLYSTPSSNRDNSRN